MNILVLNSGSSSLKFQVIATDSERIRQNTDLRLLRGEVEHFGSEAKVTVYGKNPQKFTAALPDIPTALDYVVRWIASEHSGIAEVQSPSDIHAVGHRVVHGGERFTESAVIADDVLQDIQDCAELAPLHNPNNIAGIQAVRKLLGEKTPQVAVFDTAFHQSLPQHAYLYAIPYDLYPRHRIRRYGFHGTSHRYVSYRYRILRGLTQGQTHVITLHLGNGCSAAAIRNGHPVDTPMGMTPLEGLVMGTRSGDLDPAVVDFVSSKEGLSPHEVDSLLNTQSGLLGISGLTNDMRVLLDKQKTNPRAALAVEIFCYRARK